jgi:hypothetical protein
MTGQQEGAESHAVKAGCQLASLGQTPLLVLFWSSAGRGLSTRVDDTLK